MPKFQWITFDVIYTLLFSIFILTAILEIVARAVRATDYMLYTPSQKIGYFPKPNTSGKMWNKYRWNINSRGMRSDVDEEIQGNSIVLVGDSIVEGGSRVHQHETLGHYLEIEAGRRVYPVGAGGWTVSNEIAFILENEDLLKTDTLVLVINTDDLRATNIWSGSTTHPINRPRCHSIFLARRVLRGFFYAVRERFKTHIRRAEPEPATEEDWQTPVLELLRRFKGRLIWVLYPSRTELRQGIDPCVQLRQLAAGRAEFVDLAKQPGWTADCYQDQLHPSAIGRRALAAILASAVLPKS